MVSTDRPIPPAREAAPDRPDAGVELAELAEAALLGALLWDPYRLRDVPWLESDDFSRPAHQAIYQTLAGLLGSGTPIDLLELPAILARGHHNLHIDTSPGGAGNGPLSAYALSRLLALTPASPAPGDAIAVPAHSEHRRYAEIVLECSIRRQVSAAGTRIEQTNREHSRRELSDVFQAIDRILEQTTSRLDDLTSRLVQASPPTIPARPATTLPAVPDPGIPSAVPAPTPKELRRAEYELIGACQTHPWLRELAHRLLPEDFTHPEVATTWIALTELVDQQIPVDYVLLAAQVQHLGVHPDYGRGLGPRELATLARRGDVVSGAHAIIEVTRAALTRAVAHAQRALTDAGQDGHSSHQILDTARAALDRVEQVRLRLGGDIGATRSAAPRRAAPAQRAPAPGRVTSASAGAARMRPRSDHAPVSVPQPTRNAPTLRR